MTRSAAITYDGLPTSSGGAHKLRTRGFTDALVVLQSFVTAVSVDPRPKDCVVEVLAGDNVPASFTSGVSPHCDARFIQCTRRRVGEYSSSQWAVDPGSLPAMIDTLEQRRPIPKAGYAGYEAVTSDARRMAEKVQSHFPARLSSNHWKIWRLTKKGDGYIGRRVSIL